MSVIENIKKDFMEARKVAIKTKAELDVLKSSLLSTLVSEINMIGKNDGNRETTIEEAMKVIQKFVKNAEETLSIAIKNNKAIEAIEAELTILKSYLPKQLSAEELESEVKAIVAELEDKSAKAMGKVMAELKARFNGQYDGKLASQIVKSNLS